MAMAPHHRPNRLVVSLLLVSLLLCVQHIISAPLQGEDDSQVVKLQYKTGSSYVYEFGSDVVTKLVGTSDDESRIKVKGQVLLTAKTPTEFILTVTKASFETPSGQTLIGTNSKLEGTAIGFTNENGVLKCTVQLQKDDATWSANVKRALISLFTNYAYREGQFPAASYSELDVSGYNCQTRYTVNGNKYEKTRDLNTCSKRDGSFSTSQAVTYTVEESDAPQTDTTIKSDQTCTQEFSSGILRSTDCTETHKLTAFSSGDAGALTTIKSNLKFVEESNAIMKITEFDTSKEYKIFFDFSDEDKASAPTRTANTIALLKDLCTEIKNVITTSEVSDKYLRLKREVANAPESGLRQAYDSLNSGASCADASAKKKLTKLFLSAVASAGSSDSIAFFADLYNDNSVVDERLQRIYRLSLAFAVRPRDNALTAVQKLLDSGSPNNRLIVTAGGLGHQFCHANPNCETNAAYTRLVKTLASYAEKNCLSKNPKEVSDAIAGLQALGNLHEVTDVGEKTVVKCLGGVNRIRINALQAFRHNPCAEGPRQEASNIFHDVKQPAHIRIHAYIALSKCMCSVEAHKIVETLKSPGEVDQVRNYVCTQAQNFVDSVSPGRNKPELKEVFDIIKCTTYRKDVRKYSANLESSHYESEQNLGYSSEANIVYSPESFVPKTLQLNFTMDHAGKSYNFLEVAINSEGYEEYLESVFGPKGKRPQKLDAPAYKGFVPRGKRAVSNAPSFNEGKIKALQSQVSLPAVPRDEKGVSDFYIRIWGTTIATKTLTVDELVTFYKGIHASKSKTDSFRNLLVNHDLEMTEQIPILSDELLLPTVSGLPLRLAVDGSLILSMNIHSKFDENTLNLNGNWIASANSVVRGKQTVGAGPIEAGLQVEINTHATHNSGFTLAVTRGEAESTKIDAKILLPEETIRAFSYTSKIYLIESKNYELPSKTELGYKVPINTNKITMLGGFILATNGRIEYPNIDRSAPGMAVAKYPLSGPVTVEGKLVVADPAIKELSILLDYKTNAAKDDRSMKLVLDAPGSKTNRKIEASLKFKKTGPGNVEQEASYVSERVKASLFYTDKTAGTSNDKELKVSFNGKDYGVKVHSDLVEEEEQISALITTQKVKFDASYYSPDGSGTLLKGNALRSKKVEDDKTSGKLTLNAETDLQKSGASGTIEWEKQKDGSGYKVILTDVQGNHNKFGKFIVNGKVSGSKTTSIFLSDISAKYGASAQHELNIVANVDKSKEGRAVVEAKLASTRKPELNFDIKWERDFAADPKKISFSLNKGPRTIALSSDFANQADGFVANSDLKVKCTQSGTDFNLISKVTKAGKKVDSDVTIKSGSFNAASKFNADYAAQSYNFKANGNGYGQDFTYVSSLTTSGDTKSHKVTIKAGDFDLDVATDVLNSEAKTSLVSVIISDKFLTQPYTFRTEAYPETTFKNKEIKKVKKALIQVLRGQDRITSFITEKTGPASYKIEVYQQNVLEASLVAGLSKGTIVLDTDVNIPSKRRVVSNLELKASPAAVDITTEVKWDANKDPTKVLSFKSSSTKNGANIVSKNVVDISGEKRELNIETKVEPKFINADHSFSIDYITAQKSYSVGVDSRIDISDKTKGTKMGLKIQLPGQKPLSFRVDSEYTEVDAEKYFFDYYLNYEGDISDDDVKDQFLKLKMSQRPVNGGRSANIEASGRLISATPKGVSLQIDTSPGPVKTVKVKYVRKDGDTKVTGVDASVSHDITKPEKVLAIKLTYDKFTGKPTLNADVAYTYTFNSFRDFQITETFIVAYDTFSTSGENTLKINANEFFFKTISKLAQGGEAPITIQDFEVNAGNKNGKYNVLADVRNLFTNPLEAADDSPSKIIPKLEIEVEPKLPNVKVSIVAERLPKVGNVELKISHDEAAVSGGQKRTTSIKSKLGDQSAAFSSVLEFGSGKAATDFSIKINNDPERKLSLLVQDSGSGPTAEASVSWGDKPNESIKTMGNVVKTANGGFDADLKFDKTPLTNQWSLKITRTVESEKKAKFVFNAESPDSNQVVKISLDRNIDLAAQSSLKANYEISLAKYVTGKHSGKLQIDLDLKAFAPEKGGQFSLDFEGSKDGKLVDKTKIVVKASESEKRLTLSSDCDKPYCVDANIGVKTTENAGSLEFTVVRDNIKRGIVVESSKSADYQTLKSDVQVFFARDKQQEDFAVALYKEPGQADDIDLIKSDLPSAASKITRVGLDVKLDDRTISWVSGHGVWGGSLAATACQLNLWLDKSRKPNEKFAWLGAKINESPTSRNFLLISKRPVSDKTFRIKTSRVSQNIQNFDVKVEFDIFKRKEDTVTIAVKRSGDASNDVWDSSLISDGQGIAHKKNCVFQTNGDSQTADCTVSLKTPGATDASFKFTSNCSPKTKTVKFDQLTPEKKSYYINAEFNDVGCLKSLDYILPGFTPGDARSIKITKSEAPQGYTLKTSLKSEGEDYTELFVGQVVAQGLGLKLTRTEKGAQNDLLEIRRVENSTHLRSYEFLWNADNIKKSLTRLEAVGVQRSDNFATLLKQRAEAIRKRVKGFQQSTKSASIDLDPSFEYLKNQIEQIGKELRVDPSKLIAKVEAVRAYAKKERETIRESVVAKSLDKLAELVQSGKDTIPMTFGKIRSCIDELASSPDINLDELYSKPILAGIRQGFAKLKALNDKIYKKQQENPTFDKIAKLVRGQLASMYAEIAKVNKEHIAKAFPYPDAIAGYEPVASYIRQRIATPEKQTLNDDFREMMFAKLDAAWKALLANTLYTRFAAGHAVINIPVLTEVPWFKQFVTVSRDRRGFGAGLSHFRGYFPAPGHAMIYGTKDFRTFDGKVVPFAGVNQYLLAYDSNKQFTVAVDISKNEGNEEKFLYVSDGKDKAVIAQDGTIFLNGKRAIRGTKSGSLEVIREGYSWDGVQSDAAGVTVVCQKAGRWTNLNELPCIVRISGYYHSKVTGAMGFYNNEETDDSVALNDWVL